MAPLQHLLQTGAVTAYSLLVGATALLSIAVAVPYFVRKWREDLPAWAKTASVLLILFTGTCLASCFPGFIGLDNLNLYDNLRAGHLSAWQSHLYSALVKTFWELTGNPFAISVFDFLLFSFLVVSVLSLLKQKLLPAVMGLLLLATPVTLVLVFFENRDSTFSLLLALLCTELLAVKDTSTSPRFPRIAFWAFLLGACFEIRPETRYLTLVLPFLLMQLLENGGRNPRFLPNRRYFAAALLPFLVFSVPAIVHEHSTTLKYRSVAYISPLSYILSKKGEAALTPEEAAKIDPVIKVRSLVEAPDLLDVGPLRVEASPGRPGSGKRPPVDRETFRNFERAAFHVITRNPALWLRHRFEIAKSMFNLSGRPFLFSNEGGSGSLVLDGFHRFLASVFHSQDSLLRILLFSCLVPFGTTVFLAGRRLFTRAGTSGTAPRSAGAIAILLLVRTGLVVTFAPAAYFRYVSSLWILGWILLFLLLQEWQGRRESMTAERS